MCSIRCLIFIFKPYTTCSCIWEGHRYASLGHWAAFGSPEFSEFNEISISYDKKPEWLSHADPITDFFSTLDRRQSYPQILNRPVQIVQFFQTKQPHAEGTEVLRFTTHQRHTCGYLQALLTE